MQNRTLNGTKLCHKGNQYNQVDRARWPFQRKKIMDLSVHDKIDPRFGAGGPASCNYFS